MKFSICIPNYNYERYIGRTIQSVLDQTHQDFEILVSDNASTDGSVKVVRSFSDDRIKLSVNRCNVGFAGNLDRAARMATGDVMIMLSSDDVMRPDALRVYNDLYSALGKDWNRSILCSGVQVIDPDDAVTDALSLDYELYLKSGLVPDLSATAGGSVYRMEGEDLLRRCIRCMKNPFFFLATAYPRAVYEAVEGYGGGRQVNPDKWFGWKILSAGTTVHFVDRPLFAYRWHPANQNSQEVSSAALKYLADEYVSTFELDRKLIERLGLSRSFVEQSFVERDIARHGLHTLALGERSKAERIYYFGRATYPTHSRKNPKVWALRALLALGPMGEVMAKAAFRVYERAEPREAPFQNRGAGG